FAAEEAPFIDRLRRSIEERRADGRSLALLLVDCGLIERIDALWGFQIGDAVRSRLISSLRADALRADDFVGTLGRDDLACVLSSVESPQIASLAAQKVLRVLNAPLWLGEEEVFASPSIGIAVFSGGAGNAESMVQQAKIACVAARDAIGRVALYDEERDSGISRLVRESRLRSAVAEDALELVFQPQFDLRFGQIMGVESMLRWSGAELELVPMRDAFAAAEAGGLVPKLISSVLNRALRNCSDFRQRAGLDLRIAIHLPARALLEPELADLIGRALGTWALRAGRLVLEIGDIAILDAYPETQATIRQLAKIGVKLSIDDPRASISSLFWLAALPFNELKIDLNLVSGWMGDARAEGVLKSLIDLVHQLKLDVVAIGVQDDAAAARLLELGCDFIQADFKGPPVDPEEFVVRFAG
ncbi:MAG: GGDEF domain-containing phosphodiesterase, partial [Pseudomonadota bacterium]